MFCVLAVGQGAVGSCRPDSTSKPVTGEGSAGSAGFAGSGPNGSEPASRGPQYRPEAPGGDGASCQVTWALFGSQWVEWIT